MIKWLLFMDMIFIIACSLVPYMFARILPDKPKKWSVNKSMLLIKSVQDYCMQKYGFVGMYLLNRRWRIWYYRNSDLWKALSLGGDESQRGCMLQKQVNNNFHKCLQNHLGVVQKHGLFHSGILIALENEIDF